MRTLSEIDWALTRPFHPGRQSNQAAYSGSLPAIQAMARDGLQFHQRGQLAEAEQIYRKILAIDPRHADSLHLLGALAHQVSATTSPSNSSRRQLR